MHGEKQLMPMAILVVLLVSFPAIAQDNISGTLTGTLGPGTYIVVGDCEVLSEQSLQINPGTTFLHSGHYIWNVYGQLNAEGTESDPIRFLRQSPVEEHKWGGIRFQQGSSSASTLAWCELEYCKNLYYPNYNGGAIYLDQVSITISNCTITNSQASSGGGIYAYYGISLVIDNCTITNCTAGNGGGIYLYFSDGARVMNCTVADNISNST